MVKKSTILAQTVLSLLLATLTSFGLAWALVFDLLKDKMNWSARESWPFFYIVWLLLLIIWLIHLWRRSRERLLLLNLMKRLYTLANHPDLDHKSDGNDESDLPENQEKRQLPTYSNQARQLTALVDRVVAEFNLTHEEQLAVEKSKDEMMTNISHDLRTPLTAIIGYLGLVVTPNSPLSEEDQAKYLKTAYHKSNQMKTLVEDLFEFAKLQTTQVSLNITDFSLGDLFDQVLANYAMEAENRHLRFATNLDPRVIVMAGDSDKLARVLINLVENALKYGQGASFIKLTGQVKENGLVEIRVINDGPAIPASSANHIFQRFYRVEESRNNKTGGTGLGLAIVKGIIDQHNGHVKVESDETATAFVMTLPLKQVKEE
ncbi:cell wall metabolism sensor histidine kinase WalK [Fructobacillus cardui]|uniref:histidine kinase n=1 Tax=Fructobacillus cardui TaxID=2893170 RepID=A0ABM9MLH6_9LACO|nr:HAMP domain-containing sensor histidine kinase [uncultured Fructobacillus sp.]CAK1224710.1 Sensor histidine kinase WalK (WalK) [Fructobacillus cardui]CAK1254164.1 Sensor histidine kinase WalK (WalK) [Fructobacillus cardui]